MLQQYLISIDARLRSRNSSFIWEAINGTARWTALLHVLWRRGVRKEKSTRYVNILIKKIYRMNFSNINYKGILLLNCTIGSENISYLF